MGPTLLQVAEKEVEATVLIPKPVLATLKFTPFVIETFRRS